MPTNELKSIQQKKILWGLATVHKLRNGSTRFKFETARILGVLITMLVVGWVGLFSAAYIHFKYRRDYKEVSYFETLIFPFNRESFQNKRGEYYIETAYKAIEAGDYKQALNFLRNGLLRSPNNLKARRTLSEFYEFIFNRPKLAFNLLNDGIPFLPGQPTEVQIAYIKNLFALGSRNQLDSLLIEAGETIKSELHDELPQATEALVDYQIASGHRNKGEIEAAEKIIEEKQLHRFSEGLVLQAQLLWDKGMEAVAIKLLEQKINQYQENRAIYGKLISLLEEKRDIDTARQFSLLYQLEHPKDVLSHIARLQHYYKYNPEETELINRFISEFFETFQNNQMAMRQLAIVVSKYGDVANTTTILNKFSNANSEQSQLLSDFILIESMIRSHRYDDAIAKLDEIRIKTEENPLNPDSASILNSLEIAAYHGNGNESKVSEVLQELIASPVIKIDRYLAVAHLFLEVDAPEIALEIMNHCLQTQETNANIREVLIAIYLKSEDVDALSNVLLESIDARRLPNKLLIDSYRLLSSDRNSHVKNRTKVMDKIQSCFSTDYLFKKPNT